MQEYWKSGTNTGELARGMFIILPLKYDQKLDLKSLKILGQSPIGFESSDFVELLALKCRAGNFVQRYQLDVPIKTIWLDNGIPVTDLQLFVFNNGIAFLSAYLAYTNADVDTVYKFVYPGYTDDEDEWKTAQSMFLRDIRENILEKTAPQMRWFMSDSASQSFIIKEAYRLNTAYIPERFADTEIVNRITYNEHRIIDLTRDFEDLSEKDVLYVTGARDVQRENYGWGCSITSQEISYAYVGNESKARLADRASDDLLLTILVMYQKYTCILLNEEIHQRYMAKGKSSSKKSIQALKREALEFVAYGTLAPSQISRWNNVCETYRLLLELNGVNEALAEIAEKINLLDDEQERLDSKRESTIGMIIAVFGLVSIISAVLEIVDYVSAGRTAMTIGFWSSLAGVLLFGAVSIVMLIKKKRNEDI